MKKLYKLFFVLVSLLCSNVYAQVTLSDMINNSKAEKTDESQIDIKLDGYRLNGDSVHVEIPRGSKSFFSGNFFKRLSSNKLNLPSRSYKDRYFECDNCNILNYSVEMLMGCTCVKDLDLEVPRGIRKSYINVTSKTGESIGVVEIMVRPKVDIYLKVNDDALVKMEGDANFPFEVDNRLSIVVLSDEGKVLNVDSHYMRFFDSMGDIILINGAELTQPEKQQIITRNQQNRSFALVVKILDEDGWTWKKTVYVEKGKVSIIP